MRDVLLLFSNFSADLRVLSGDLEPEDSLYTAVVISLFTDRRADYEDELPAGETDLRGWWADDTLAADGDRIGSKLWLIRRRKQTQEVALLAAQYAREALDWLIEDGLARDVEVSAEFVSAGFLGIRVTVDARTMTFDYPWEE